MIWTILTFILLVIITLYFRHESIKAKAIQYCLFLFTWTNLGILSFGFSSSLYIFTHIILILICSFCYLNIAFIFSKWPFSKHYTPKYISGPTIITVLMCADLIYMGVNAVEIQTKNYTHKILPVEKMAKGWRYNLNANETLYRKLNRIPAEQSLTTSDVNKIRKAQLHNRMRELVYSIGTIEISFFLYLLFFIHSHNKKLLPDRIKYIYLPPVILSFYTLYIFYSLNIRVATSGD